MYKSLFVLLFVFIVLISGIFAGCGASEYTSDQSTAAPANNSSRGVAKEAYNKDSKVRVQFDEELAGEMNFSDADSGSAAVTTSRTAAKPVSSIRKVIKNGDVSIEVKKAGEAFDKISKWVNTNGGYEFNRNSSVSGDSTQITAVFKLPPEKLGAFIKFLEDTGKVINSNISSDDITDQYYDIASRLESNKKARDQFLEILKKAQTVDEILKVQNELNRINEEIDSLQGRINMWDKLVAESTINLTITEESAPLKPAEDVEWKFSSFNDVLKSMKNGFILTVNTIVNILEWGLVILVSASPVLLIVAIVIFIIYRSMRKKRKAQPPTEG